MVRQFENLELTGRGDYHKLRSLMFVYHYLGRIDRFLELAPLNKAEYPRAKWENDLKYDLDSGRSGHTFTYQILDELGAFDTALLNKNKDTIVSNYLQNRLSNVQCYKELNIPVDRYLPIEKIKEILRNSSKSGSRVLIIAPTGTGKTYSVINAMKDLGLKGILSVPNRMNAQQNMITYGIGGAFQDHPITTAISEHKIVSAVWEMLGSNDLDYSDHILINDEAHAHVHDLS